MVERAWVDPPDVVVPPELQAEVDGHPLVAETLVRRGIRDVAQARAFLDPDTYTPASPFELPDLEVAVERLERAIAAGESISVWGDFDVDGQTATTLLVSTLEDLGGRVRYHIPDRQKRSHGVHLPQLKTLIDEGVELVLTCDTGITAHRAVDYAQERGVDVVITDHHDLPETLPPAHAVVDPKRLPPDHPLRELPGVGVADELALALYQRAGQPENARRHLDLVALGIVADVATQTGDVRYLLQRGLEVLRRTERLGLRALMDQAGVRPETVDEEEIGFGLAPRLNALGRLDDANVAVELLTTEDLARARVLASMLEGLNARRKLLCDQVTQAALARIEEEPALLEHGALVLADPAWPGGVLGIVAGRLADRYGRPALLLKAPPDEVARGSARSVEGCNITAAIAAHQDLLVKFGGHPMAAGLSIEPGKIPAFRRALGRTVEEMMARAEVVPTVEIDGYLPLADLSLDLVKELERLAPFGPGNPQLVLATRGLSVASRRTIGRRQSHRLVMVEDEAGVEQKVVWWRGADREMPEGTFDLAYTLSVNEYRGQREVQVVWVDARPVGPPVEEVRPAAQALEVVDYRWEPNPRRLLGRVRTRHGVAVWAEAGDRATVDGQDRRELAPASELVIWTAPPGPAELRAALAAVGPERVVVFARDPGMDEAAAFLGRLAGLVKRALRVDEGRVELATLAAATAQRETTVRRGIAWLVAKGQVAVVENMGAEMILAPGGAPDPAAVGQATGELQALLAETAAYRTHFARAEDVEQLLRPYAPKRGR